MADISHYLNKTDHPQKWTAIQFVFCINLGDIIKRGRDNSFFRITIVYKYRLNIRKAFLLYKKFSFDTQAFPLHSVPQ